MDETKPNDNKALELALAQIDRDFGKGSIMRLGDDKVEPWPSISTGALSLDVALGIGGLPRGRIVEIYGMESSGKTSIALSVVAEAQQQGLVCAYVDVENALDPGYMQALGINMQELLLVQPDNAENALEITDRLVRTGTIGVIVIDSVAALVPQAELEGDMGQSHIGLQARLMSQALRKINKSVSDTRTLLIFINQLREKVGVFFGSSEITSGGKALKFYASVRIDLRKTGDVKDKSGNVIGSRVKAKTVKNKMAPALRIAEFDIIYGVGVSAYGCIVDLAIEKGIISRKGKSSWYEYEGESYQGRDALVEAIASDLDLANIMKGKILSNGGE